MGNEFESLPGRPANNASLTQGLARNIMFNLLGWVWPIGLAILSVPYIVSKMGSRTASSP